MDAGDAYRKRCGGVLRYGNVCVQRGVQLRSEDDAADDADRTEQVQEKASVEEISLPLLTKMSSERTLAVRRRSCSNRTNLWHCWHGRSA